VDVAETGRGYWYVLRWYLCLTVNLDLLAVQAGLGPGGAIFGETFSYITGGYEEACGLHTLVGGVI
jgi:hypothetical protein